MIIQIISNNYNDNKLVAQLICYLLYKSKYGKFNNQQVNDIHYTSISYPELDNLVENSTKESFINDLKYLSKWHDVLVTYNTPVVKSLLDPIFTLVNSLNLNILDSKIDNYPFYELNVPNILSPKKFKINKHFNTIRDCKDEAEHLGYSTQNIDVIQKYTFDYEVIHKIEYFITNQVLNSNVLINTLIDNIPKKINCIITDIRSKSEQDIFDNWCSENNIERYIIQIDNYISYLHEPNELNQRSYDKSSQVPFINYDYKLNLDDYYKTEINPMQRLCNELKEILKQIDML